MSLDSWEAKYYPVSAAEATDSLRQALLHAFLKYQGLFPEVLQEHGLRFDNDNIVDVKNGATFSLTAETCAVCEFQDKFRDGCTGCPFNYGGCCCGGAYGQFLEDGDPTPILGLIRQELD